MIYPIPQKNNLNGKKINYHDFIVSCNLEQCNEALKRIKPRIDMEKISDFIDGVEELSAIQKSFYKRYLNGRYEKILLYAYEKLTN